MALQSNLLRKSSPTLVVKPIQDVYIRDNFKTLEQYFLDENQLLGFEFFEVIFTGVEVNRKVAHTLGTIPKDIIVTKISGSGIVKFNTGLFTTTELDISATGAVKIRFFVGTYWDQQSSTNDLATDFMEFQAGNSLSTLNTMPTNRIKGRVSLGDGDQENLTPAQVTAMLSVFLGDLGNAGLKGLVPKPAIGDGAKFLKGDGTWSAVPSAGITSLTGDGTAAGSGSVAFTLATVNANVGAFGSASKTVTYTVNGKGLLTASAQQDIAIVSTQVTDFSTAVAAVGAAGTDFTLANNQSSAASVTGATVDGATYKGAKVFGVIQRTDATPSDKMALVEMSLYYQSGTWKIAGVRMDGDDMAGSDAYAVTFSVTTASGVAQLKYTTGNMTGGSYTGNFRWRMIKT